MSLYADFDIVRHFQPDEIVIQTRDAAQYPTIGNDLIVFR